jgi:antitoxin component HigA of HigAB toxin-antitoxin module
MDAARCYTHMRQLLDATRIAALEAKQVEVKMPEPVAYIQHHKAGDNLEWDCPGGKFSALYTEQQVRKLLAAAKVERKPLTDEAIRTLYGESDGHWQMVGPQVLCFARSIESVHGITQEKQG